MKEKTQLMGHGNHEQVASLLQTGSVRSLGETSLTLFLLAVYHFVGKIAFVDYDIIPYPVHNCYNQPHIPFLYSTPSPLSKQHPQFVIEENLLWSSKSIIRGFSLCQRYVKETLSSVARRYLAKLNTLPDTFCLLCLMETPLADILAEDSCLDNPTPVYDYLTIIIYYFFFVIPFLTSNFTKCSL